jgi:hypothetical protein
VLSSRHMTEKQTLDELGAFVKRAEEERDAELEEWARVNSPNWETTEEGRTFSAAQRKSAAKSGASLPDGSYPIFNLQDAMNALRRIGTGKASRATILAHIRKRARQLGFKPPGMAGQGTTS